MNKEKRLKRSKEKKKNARKSIYTSKIKEFKGLVERANKGLEDINNQEKELLKDSTLEEILKEQKEVEESKDEIKIKEYKERVGRLYALQYTRNVFNDVLKKAEEKISNYKENL